MTDEMDVLATLKRQGMDLEAIIKQTQGGSVLILTQLLANTLEHYLIQVMQPFKAKTRKDIFGGMGPLSGLSAKIHIAYGIGLLTKELYEDAHTIRGIRNKFAHAKDRLDLTSESIALLVEKLSTYKGGVKPKDAVSRAVEKIARHVTHAAFERTKDQPHRKEEDLRVED